MCCKYVCRGWWRDFTAVHVWSCISVFHTCVCPEKCFYCGTYILHASLHITQTNCSTEMFCSPTLGPKKSHIHTVNRRNQHHLVQLTAPTYSHTHTHTCGWNSCQQLSAMRIKTGEQTSYCFHTKLIILNLLMSLRVYPSSAHKFKMSGCWAEFLRASTQSKIITRHAERFCFLKW